MLLAVIFIIVMLSVVVAICNELTKSDYRNYEDRKEHPERWDFFDKEANKHE